MIRVPWAAVRVGARLVPRPLHHISDGFVAELRSIAHYRSLRRLCALAAACLGTQLTAPVAAFELEFGEVILFDTFATPSTTPVLFSQPFSTPPLVFALRSSEGGDPSTLRITDVTTAGFNVKQVEPEPNDGPHVAMTVPYLAIEAGDHRLPDGSELRAFVVTTTAFQANPATGSSWEAVSFAAVNPGVPAVLASIQSEANETGTPPSSASVPFLEVAIRNVSNTGLDLALERAEALSGTISAAENIAVLVIDDGVFATLTDPSGTSVTLQSLVTPQNVQGWDNGCFTNSYAVPFATTPLAVASMNTRAGNNGGWLRSCSGTASQLGLRVDEDLGDGERSHIGERAGVFAASAPFHANVEPLSISKEVVTTSDPVNGTSFPKAIPSAVLVYTLEVENPGALSPDGGSIVVTDTLPEALGLCVTTLCMPGGPVVFDTSGSPVAVGATLDSIAYSNDGGMSFTYTPVPDADGFDADVEAVRISLSGSLAPLSTAGAASFELRFAVRLD